MNRRIVVCGGSKFNDYPLLESSLNKIFKEYSDDTIEIVSGHAKGADYLGEKYADEHNFKCTVFEADWKQYGRAAGPIRNSKMLEYAKQENPMVVAFWDGESRGTKDTLTKAQIFGIFSKVVKYEKEK